MPTVATVYSCSFPALFSLSPAFLFFPACEFARLVCSFRSLLHALPALQALSHFSGIHFPLLCFFCHLHPFALACLPLVLCNVSPQLPFRGNLLKVPFSPLTPHHLIAARCSTEEWDVLVLLCKARGCLPSNTPQFYQRFSTGRGREAKMSTAGS